ncbi:MAG: acetate kinase [Acidobacteriota bacterium]
MNVLVLNCGSSSIKFQIIKTNPAFIESNLDKRLAKGLLERIGFEDAIITLQAEGQEKKRTVMPLKDHVAGLNVIMDWISSPDTSIEGINSISDIYAVGHRVVHGGEDMQESALITEEVISIIGKCCELAPLHNPANLMGITACRELLGDSVPQVAVFDTAFHSSMPKESFLYAIPYGLYEDFRIRRYGFHGTSHRYVTMQYARETGISTEDVNIVTLHLGNGTSACAVKNGKSIDTSMGFTPLEGLVMGTRSGDVDPSLIEYIGDKKGLTAKQVLNMLNKESGMLGLTGKTSDMRDIEDSALAGDERCDLALDIFAHRARAYVGRYFVEMGGAQAVVFTGGVGENSPMLREKICRGLESIGLKLDREANNKTWRGVAGPIHAPESTLKAHVIPTNEELLIARDTVLVVKSS